MPLDTSIATRVQPVQLADPMELQAKAMSLRDMSTRAQMADMQIAEKQRQQQESMTLADLYRRATNPDGTVNHQAMVQSMAGAGLGARIPVYQKQMADAEKARADVGHVQAQTGDLAVKTEAAKAQYVSGMAGRLLANPNVTAQDVIAELSKVPEQFRENAAAMARQLPADPVQLRRYLLTAGLSAQERLKALTPELESINNGKVTSWVDTNPMTNPGGPAPVKMTTTPGQDQDAAVSRENSKRSASVAIRGQNMTDARQREANLIANAGVTAKNETELRKEFADLPEVKNYKAAYPAFAAVKDAATRATPQADINLIYGLAKLYDPTSVVREGEYGTIANSQAIPEWLKGHAQRLAGGGRLTAETKRQIMVEAESRIGAYEGQYVGAQGTYRDVATKRGMNPSSVFTPVGRVGPDGTVTGGGGKTASAGGVPSDIQAILQKHGGK